jgi:hypothetical protein
MDRLWYLAHWLGHSALLAHASIAIPSATDGNGLPHSAERPSTTSIDRSMCAARTPHNGAAAATFSPPVTRLYRHALESIFAFCSLSELVSVVRVSKNWAAAVQSMRPLGAAHFDVWSLARVCASRLSRHVGSLRWSPQSPSVDALSVLSLRLPHLHTLRCWFCDDWSSLVFPARLRRLDVLFASAIDFHDVLDGQLDIGPAIRAIAALPLLESFTLKAEAEITRCCLSPLVDAPALSHLALELYCADALDSTVNIEALRNMPHLRSLEFTPSTDTLARMLEPPQTMQLDTLCVNYFTAEHGAAIVHLPSLTDLQFNLWSTHTDFLCRLPNLHRLELKCDVTDEMPDATRIMQSLHSLTGLTELSLIGESLRFTPTHLLACLTHMPLLTSLQLSQMTALDSLCFLSTGPITYSLIKLTFIGFDPPLRLAELVHVNALTGLRTLRLLSVFDRPMDEQSVKLYTPPSSLLLSLCDFEHECERFDGGSDEEEGD